MINKKLDSLETVERSNICMHMDGTLETVERSTTTVHFTSEIN